MEKLLNELGISLFDIQSKEMLSKEFKRIADKLFQEYEIICGDKHFRFAEIEFYYYRTGGMFDKEWNCITYARRNKKDGDFMYHYSGVDMCFKSNFSDECAEFGGILIRSIYTTNKEGKREMIFGPLACKDEMLNYCKCEMPKLCKSKVLNRCDVKATSLAGVPENKKSDYCFYDSSIGQEEWKREVERYNVHTQKTYIYKSKYNTDRFSLRQKK